MVPTSPRKLQSGSEPVTISPAMSDPPPKNADGGIMVAALLPF